MKWSEDKKEYFRKLFPANHLEFLSTGTGMKVSLATHDLSAFDYVVALADYKKCYIIFSAQLHIGKSSISFNCKKEIFRENKIQAVSKYIGQKGLSEKFLIIPYGQEDRLSRNLDHWFNDIIPVNDNGTRTYACYNVKTQSIEAID